MGSTSAEDTLLQVYSYRRRAVVEDYSTHVSLPENIVFCVINSGVTNLNLSFPNNLNTVSLTRNIIYLFAGGGRSGTAVACCALLIGLLI